MRQFHDSFSFGVVTRANRLVVRSLCLGAILGLLVLLPNGLWAAATRFADAGAMLLPNGTEYPVGSGHIVGTDVFAKLQDAVDATPSGGTVLVAAGAYPELVVVSLPVTLLGANAGIDPRDPACGGGVRGPESVIDGMGVETAIVFLSSGITLDGFTIQGGCCDGFNAGLHMGGSFNDNHVLNNIITGNTIGVFANCAGPLPTVIRRNLFNANNLPGPAGGSGIYVDGSVNLHLLENELTGHTMNNPLIIGATGASSHTGLLVSANNIHDNACGCSAVYALGISGGTFEKNQISAEGSGIRLGGADVGVSVKSNLFTAATVGVRVVDDSVGFGANSDVHINANSFAAVLPIAVGNELGYGDPVLDASANWWSDNTLAGIQAKLDISGGPIDFTPWLDTGSEPVPNVCDGFQGNFATLHVDDDSPQSGATGRIQEGINLVSPSGTIKIMGGTYAGNADASANAVILSPGASPAKVTINGNLTLTDDDALDFELNGLVAGTDYDQICVNGTVDLGGATFNASATFTYADCTILTLIMNDGIDAVSGTFDGLPNGAAIVIGGQSFKILYNGGDGNDVTVMKDATPPDITAITATEMQLASTVNVKNCANATVPGTVMIAIQASDACGPVGTPSLGLTNGANGEAAVFVDQNPTGQFNYTWNVTSGTANGTWIATVTASDGGNSASTTFTLCVNRTNVIGQLQLQGFKGTGTVPLHTRTVTFVATEVPMAGVTNVLKTWVLSLSNVSGDTFSYTLLDAPAGATHLSAKTAWNLRRRLPVPAFDLNGQSVVNFSGGNQLHAGDMNGDNRVQTFDYGILSLNWLTTASVADLDGTGAVQTFDYGLLSLNWLTLGDPQ